MTTWFISDTHFNHANIINFCNRPFKDVSEMNSALIKNWNKRVSPDDIVYHLGDFAMGDRRLIPRIINSLNGKIILIKGNHDKKDFLDSFHEVHERLVINLYDKKIELAHSPGHLKFDCDFSLCGHVHNQWKMKKINERIHGDDRSNEKVKYPDIIAKTVVVNVGVDVCSLHPISIEEILGMIY